MPNTLAHLGVQGLITHTTIKDAEPKWIAFGCLIPDMPWILQRAIATLLPQVDGYELRLYAIAQASLCISLLLCGAAAFISAAPSKVGRILALNVLLHLLLDACQIKWANGVHLIAPLSWQLLSFGWFWPETIPTIVLTLSGLIYMIWAIPRQPARSTAPYARPVWQWGTAIGLAAAYVLAPMGLRHSPYVHDNHYVQTLRNHPQRTGRQVEMDRRPYTPRDRGATVATLVDEQIRVSSQPLPHAATVSLRGTFIDPDTIRIDALYVHWPWFRDGASYLGIILMSVLWLKSVDPKRYLVLRNRL
jgi:hypothetical protein